MSDSLTRILEGIDWKANIAAFGGQAGVATRIGNQLARLSLWSAQLINAEVTNPAIAFVQELQVQGHYAAALLGLGLYKPAASAMRAIAECALYYTYFRVHPMELATLARGSGFYVEKRDILDFHRQHSPGFRAKDGQLGMISSLEAWYSEISGIIHGQQPGKWVTHRHLSELACNPHVLAASTDLLERGVAVVDKCFFCTMSPEIWASFAANAKRDLLKTLSVAQRSTLGLSIA